MVDDHVFPDLQDLDVEKCQRLRDQNLALISQLEARDGADDSAIAIQVELLRRENTLLSVLEKTLIDRGMTSPASNRSGSVSFGQ